MPPLGAASAGESVARPASPVVARGRKDGPGYQGPPPASSSPMPDEATAGSGQRLRLAGSSPPLPLRSEPRHTISAAPIGTTEPVAGRRFQADTPHTYTYLGLYPDLARPCPAARPFIFQFRCSRCDPSPQVVGGEGSQREHPNHAPSSCSPGGGARPGNYAELSRTASPAWARRKLPEDCPPHRTAVGHSADTFGTGITAFIPGVRSRSESAIVVRFYFETDETR